MCTAQKCPDLAGTGGLLCSCPSAEDHSVGRAASLLGQMDSFRLWVAGFYDIFQNYGFSGRVTSRASRLAMNCLLI